VVQGEVGFRQALSTSNYQLILADYRLPGFDGLTALRIAQEIQPETPFLFVSGEMGEELAIASLKAGAADYVLKDNLNRLVPALENALAKAEASQARAKAEKALRDLARQWQGTFDAVLDAIFIVGADHQIVRCNKAFLVLVGKGHEEEVLGRPCWEIVHGADGPIASCPLAVTIQQGKRASTEILLGDKYVEVVTYPLEINTPGHHHGAVHIIRDITAIQESQILLQGQAEAMASTNTALKLMLNHSRQAEAALQEKFMANIKGLILPYLDQLETLSTNDDALAYLRLIRNNIKNLATSFSKDLSSPIMGLTPREIQIADLIRSGKSSKEIAHILRLSKGTVDCYREQIRKKMDVKNKKVNLRSYLLSDFS
jgi:PAS domain S-box-containing protein